ncbi:MAG TPA: pyridoxal phosphate-dependent aminotransferase [Ktedonobacterales bacterium]|nr:pyridoxal phosphate-dependent aminotransferase [Ktedonobacterales bacterium]
MSYHPISPTPLVAGLPATVPFVAPEALQRQSGRTFRLRLGANESNFGPSPRALAAMREAAGRVNWYCDPDSYELRAAVAALHGVATHEIVFGSGIDDLLGLVVRAYLSPGEVAVTSLGAYPTFNYHVAGYGGRLERVPYRDDRNDLETLAAAAHQHHARIVYLANPDNPTGSWYSAEAIRAFQDALPEGCLLMLDEAYIEFAPADEVLPLDIGDPRIIRLRTFSKAHGMAGARIGYALGPAEMMSAFDRITLHFGINRVAQEGALAALADTDYLAHVVAEVARGRDEYAALGRELGLTPLPSRTNFVTFDTGGPARAKALVAELGQRDVFIRMPGAPPLDRCIRVTVGTAEERATFADILRATLPTLPETENR